MQITISKRSALIIAVAMLLVIPGVASATHIFTDVADGSTHAPGIEWVANAGVTAGCGDGSTYCPNDAVNRAQMATFMYRLSGNAPGIDPSVAAATAETADEATHAVTADDAATLEGRTLAEVLPVWALVDGDGTILQQSGGVEMASTTGAGGYYVDFNTDITGRAIITTPAYFDGVYAGSILASPCGGATAGATVCVVGGTNTPEHVFVWARNAANNGGLEQAFYIAALP